jgi:D-alanyl-lipoteichoic acid acyltransferase DltB (MBOAT superfamily)
VLFNSYAFIVAFLPLAVAAYFSVARVSLRAADACLALASLVFYAWWRLDFLWILLGSIAANHAVGRVLSTGVRTGRPSKALLAAGIASNLALLGVFKYADFFIANVNALAGAHWPFLRLALPLGISFFTFTQVAYLVDAFKGEAAEYRATRYVLFVSFFPHLLAGPIIHHREMMPQFADARLKRLDWQNVARGLALFTLGLVKKAIVADTLAPWADAGFAHAHALTFADAWITMLAYAMQLYFDFSGYTDMALGAALMFNIRLPRNFDAPHRAADIREFWRRWHITLSRFLRDYIYIPLGGNRAGERRMLALFLATFAIGGLWHGAAWTFVAWGVLHGLALVTLHFWRKLGRPLPWHAAVGLTFLFTSVAFVVFRAPGLRAAGAILASVAGLERPGLQFNLPAWVEAAHRGSSMPAANEWTALAMLAAAMGIAFARGTAADFAAGFPLHGAWRYAFGAMLAAGLVFIEGGGPFIYSLF